MKRTFLAVILGCLILPGLIFAQSVTTAAFNGLVTDSDGNPLGGAAITAVHTPTGTVYNAQSRPDGRYNIPAVRVGGPYTVKAAMTLFVAQEVKGITLRLSEDLNLSFKLSVKALAEEVTVIARSPLVSEGRTGAAQNVSVSIIETMPSLGRSFDDYARLAPQVDSRGGGAFSAVGISTRYNSIQIDGAVNNNLFGLGNAGTPGLANPISIDAVQEFQLVIAPYDVRYGGFTGAGLNAITRSGTNRFAGSAYFYGRNQDFVGKGPDQIPYGTFKQKSMGLRLGGPIIQDKMFFFFNAELGDNVSPTTYAIDDSGASDDFGGSVISIADAQRFVNILKNKYGYDPGGFGRGYRQNTSDDKKFFARLDFNISNRHRLTVRHNYVSGFNDQSPSIASSSVFPFADDYYKLTNKTNSTVLQLNSTLGQNLFNELTLNYTTIRDNRDVPDKLFPQVDVAIAGSYRMTAGTEQFSGANSLNQDIVEITDNLTWYTGKHTFTIGTHNEFFKFSNLYIRNYYGYWRFNSLDDFEIGKASRYNHDFFTNNPKERWFAKFSVAQLGAYIGDKWAILPNLNLTLGLRVDVPIINNIPAANPLVEQTYGIKTDQAASGNLLWSPRVGFNWDVFQDKKTQVRGGVGIFSGRTPYVWISNQYSNSGLEFTRFDLSNPTFGFVADPLNQPETGPGLVSGISEVNLIDKEFKYPQLLRTNLAVDQELPWGVVGTLEFIYSKTINEINYQNLNLRQTGTGVGGRWLYARDISKSFNDVIYLKNTNKGYQLSFSVQLQKNFNQDSWANLTYAYGESKDLNSGNSSQASSNFQYNHIRFDSGNPELAWSNYDTRHRIGAAVSYTFRFIKTAPTTFGLFYAGRSGRPYSHVYNSDANGDTKLENDLVYIPANIDDIILTDSAGAALAADARQAAWGQLDAFIKGDPALEAARGKIIERNASRTPWDQALDARIAQDLPVPFLRDNRLQITLDFVNVLNLLNKDWGKSQYVSNNRLRPWNYKGIDTATGKEKIQLTLPTTRFSLSNLGSRWGAQIGLRYKFN